MCDERGVRGPVVIPDPDRALEKEFRRLVSSRSGAGLDPTEVARLVCAMPERRAPQVGFVGYGDTAPGDRVLLAVDSWYEKEAVEVFQRVLREKGAHVDVVTIDVGEDRDASPLDEVRDLLRDRPLEEHPRRGKVPWIRSLADSAGYDLLLHGKGGGTPPTSYRFEQFPWFGIDHLRQGAPAYPQGLHDAINKETWRRIWDLGRGGSVRLTDPEGTDLTWTLHEQYYDEPRRGFEANPVRHYGHLLGHPVQPLLDIADAAGVVSGTTSHFGRPFPSIQVELERGRLERIHGGGEYGDAWRDALEKTRNIQYPGFPRPGMFWLWEVAIGTNPWVRRPPNVHRVSSGQFEWERRRAGVIHIGIGTRYTDVQEKWAAEQRVLYGHLHVHLLFPTYTITTRDGVEVKVIENGRLLALDDPGIRKMAEAYGPAEALLDGVWEPRIPGINAPGSYADYARDPASFIYSQVGA